MAVLLSDCRLGVRHGAPMTTDGHGDRSEPLWGALKGPWPGRASQGPDVPVGQPGGRTWVLAVDPAAWPMLQGDLVYDPDGRREWLTLSADLLTNNADPAIDYSRVEAHARTIASTFP